MGRRYSNINEGATLKKAQDALEQFRKNKVTKRTTGGTPGKARQTDTVAIKPFSTRTVDSIQARITKDSQTKLLSVIGTRALTTPTALATASSIKGTAAARIHYFEPTGSTRTYVKSKQTGLHYLKYPGESYSAPFGALSDIEEELEVSRLLKVGVMAIASSKEYRRAWVSSERIRV